MKQGLVHYNCIITHLQWMFNGGGGAIAVSSVYRVLSASLTDSGEYTCVAQNSRGQRQDTVILTVFAVTAQGT